MKDIKIIVSMKVFLVVLVLVLLSIFVRVAFANPSIQTFSQVVSEISDVMDSQRKFYNEYVEFDFDVLCKNEQERERLRKHYHDTKEMELKVIDLIFDIEKVQRNTTDLDEKAYLNSTYRKLIDLKKDLNLEIRWVEETVRLINRDCNK